jgi:hypothetical protein
MYPGGHAGRADKGGRNRPVRGAYMVALARVVPQRSKGGLQRRDSAEATLFGSAGYRHSVMVALGGSIGEMNSDPDIFRAAKLVMDQQGEEAATFAAGRADQLLEDGDIAGALVWRGILVAIEELQRGPQEDEAVN